jgi:hypothetical protein
MSHELVLRNTNAVKSLPWFFSSSSKHRLTCHQPRRLYGKQILLQKTMPIITILISQKTLNFFHSACANPDRSEKVIEV